MYKIPEPSLVLSTEIMREPAKPIMVFPSVSCMVMRPLVGKVIVPDTCTTFTDAVVSAVFNAA